MKKIKDDEGFFIGQVYIPGRLALGPMAGVTDLPFRLLCKEQGAALLCTEMVSAKGIYYKNKNSDPLMEISDQEHPIALQLFGSDPYIMSEMAKQVEERNFDILDVNMGCPVPKIVNNGEGSALMKDPKLAGEIVKGLVKAIKKPVTVKIRRGFTKEHINAVEIAKIAEENGASAVAVHGRTREQYYAGEADLEIIRQVKQALSIPVIGNGDVKTPEDALKMLNDTGCDAVMVARAARGNPWIFSGINDYLKDGTVREKPKLPEVIQMILRHAALMIDIKKEYIGIREMRKHVAWYSSGYRNCAALRGKVNEIEDFLGLEQLLLDYLEKSGFD